MAVSDIIISPATVYYSPVAEALPSKDTIAFGQPWGGNWVNVGYTLTPISLQYDQTLFELMVEQITLPVKRLRTEEKAMIETQLAEITGLNLTLPLDATITTVAASATLRGVETIEAGGKVNVTERQWGFEGLYAVQGTVQLPIRLFFFKATTELNGKLEFSKKAAVGIPIQVKALADTTKAVGKQIMIMQRVTAKNTVEV